MAPLAACIVSFAVSAIAVELPFWPHYEGKRKVELLDGRWQFGLNLGAGFDSMDASFDPDPAELTPNETVVPSTMDVALPGAPGVRGVAMYRTRFQQNGDARLQFMGCSFYCRIFIDGWELGSHRAGGYVPWLLDVPAPQGGPATRELFVLADNRFNSTTAPMHTGGDFWHYGGLLRSVLLHSMPGQGEVWVWRAYVFPRPDLDLIDINVTLTDPNFSGPIQLELDFDAAGAETVVEGTASRGSVWLAAIKVPNPRAWSLENPQLHTLAVSTAGAAVIERFGLRHWSTDAASSRVSLNGKVVKLHGWNHHTQWPDTGATPTSEQMDADLKLLREAGANYIRGAHYPQDQRWLDRLDEAGMAMWEETLGPATSVQNLQDWDFFMKYQLQQLDEMLDASLNHPSIMTWAWFNEGPSEKQEACPAYAACANQARARDPTRFVTWASNKELRDKCLEHASLVSFNSYPAWYFARYDFTMPALHWSGAASGVRKAFPSKPFVISETGAGGIFEWSHNSTAAYWTTAYQTEVISGDVDVALKDGNISGIALWHFFDFKINDHDTAQCGPCEYLKGVEPPTCRYVNVTCNRPGGLNHKGVVDFWRRKKAAYAVVASKYHASQKLSSSDGRSIVV